MRQSPAGHRGHLWSGFLFWSLNEEAVELFPAFEGSDTGSTCRSAKIEKAAAATLVSLVCQRTAKAAICVMENLPLFHQNSELNHEKANN
jgi:hypothetical protein